MDSPNTKRRVAEFVAACRRQGVKATHQRTEILRELAGTEEHPDAETIHERVRQRIPALSLDTVYRTLKLLEARYPSSSIGGSSRRGGAGGVVSRR